MRRVLTAVVLVPALAVVAQEPVVQRSAIVVGTVKRGEVRRMVRGQGELKAPRLGEVRIPGTEAGPIEPGQQAIVDTGRGTGPARVARVDGVVSEGTVRVELALDGDPPSGVAPGKAIDSVIVLSASKDVLYVAGPTEWLSGVAGRNDTIFRLEPDGIHASLVRVEYGRSGFAAVESRFERVVEVRSGLQVGDSVIVGDMSAFKGRARVRLQ